MLHQKRQSVVAGEWRVTGQHLIKQAAYGILICSSVYWFTLRLLRTHVSRCAENFTGSGGFNGGISGDLGYAEIEKFHLLVGPSDIFEHDVAGLEVAVHHS